MPSIQNVRIAAMKNGCVAGVAENGWMDANTTAANV